MEEATELSSVNVQALFDHVPDIVFFVKDEGCRYSAVNRTLVERYGLVPHDQDAIAYAERNLSRRPGNHELAEVAGMSVYQLDRVVAVPVSLLAEVH